MKRLFVYFSHTGNGDVVAEYLKDKTVDIRKVIRKKRLPKSFFWGMMTGGFLAGIKHKDKLLDFDEGVMSRVLEMTKDYQVEIIGEEYNYRLL